MAVGLADGVVEESVAVPKVSGVKELFGLNPGGNGALSKVVVGSDDNVKGAAAAAVVGGAVLVSEGNSSNRILTAQGECQAGGPVKGSKARPYSGTT